jgi:hypothetical protein
MPPVLQPQLPGPQPRLVDEILDQGAEQIELAVDDRHRLLQGWVVGQPQLQQAGRHLQRRHGIAQFVRHRADLELERLALQPGLLRDVLQVLHARAQVRGVAEDLQEAIHLARVVVQGARHPAGPEPSFRFPRVPALVRGEAEFARLVEFVAVHPLLDVFRNEEDGARLPQHVALGKPGEMVGTVAPRADARVGIEQHEAVLRRLLQQHVHKPLPVAFRPRVTRGHGCSCWLALMGRPQPMRDGVKQPSQAPWAREMETGGYPHPCFKQMERRPSRVPK